MEAYYEIANIHMRWSAPFSWEHTRAFTPFRQKDTEAETDVEIIFSPVKKEEISGGEDALKVDADYRGKRYVPVVMNGEQHLGYRVYDAPCFAWMEETEEGKIICRYLSETRERLLTDRQLFYVICPEQLLNRRHGFVLHSAFVRWQGKGIHFSGPSGTGKSTQAGLWERFEGAEILNGDRTAVRRCDGRWRAFGFPFAGSSAIYRNDSAPVAAVVILQQAQESRIVRLRQAAAFRGIYSETTLHPWDMDFLNRLIDDLQDFLEQVPVYLLACRPDQEAVRLVKEQLEETEDG